MTLLEMLLFLKMKDLLSSPPPTDANEPKAVMNARRLYNSCIDEKEIENSALDAILSVVKSEFGGWPMLEGSSWDGATFDLENLFLKLRQYSYNYIYRLSTAVDEEDSTIHTIEVCFSVR